MGKNDFFSEMHQLPPGMTEQFDEDAYINGLSSNKIQKGKFGDRDAFQELIFGNKAKETNLDTQLAVEFETLLTAKGYKQTQQGRQLLLEAVKHLRKLGVITD